jgi:hypothetical protein
MKPSSSESVHARSLAYFYEELEIKLQLYYILLPLFWIMFEFWPIYRKNVQISIKSNKIH